VSTVTRALMLAFALESTAPGETRVTRFRRRKSAYFATLVVRPDDCRMFGLVDGTGGIDVLWRQTGSPRLLRSG